jgi:hypothetical protein
LGNQQVSVVAAPVGSSSESAANTNNATVDDKGSATGQSGLAAAQTGSGTGPTGGPASAKSGGASATGLTAENVVTNGSQAVVSVGGENSGTISIQDSNTVVVQNQGGAAANSGGALANIAPTPVPSTGAVIAATQGSSSIASPVADASPNGSQRSADAVSAGPVVTNGVQNSTSSSLVGAVGTPTAMTIAQTQKFAATSGGQAGATSTGACAGSDCPPASGASSVPSAAPVPVPTSLQPGGGASSQAQSGGATAQGAAVQNVVNTNANVHVTIGGDNHGLIQIIINTITGIFNQGTAVASSGGTTAENAPGSGLAAQPATGADAASGNAQATGAVVSNNVGLQSSANVHVDGDNHNPITIVLHLATSLFNWGFGQATSGNAQANGGSGNGSASAGSGWAAAAGLLALNQVNLGASANVDITGNNYADIIIMLDFDTQIQNIGKAVAISGQAVSQAISQGATGSSGTGSSGNAVAQNGSVQTKAVDGAGPVASVAPQQVGVRSGDSQAVGVSDNIVATDNQISVATGRTRGGLASSNANYTINACGTAVSASGSTYVNTAPDPVAPAGLIDPSTMCPTPTVAPVTGGQGGGDSGATQPGQSNGTGSGRSGGDQGGSYGPNTSGQGLLPGGAQASGSHINLNLFSSWPAPDGLNTPNQQVRPMPLPLPGRPAALQPQSPYGADGSGSGTPVNGGAGQQTGPAYGSGSNGPVTISQAAREVLQANGVTGTNVTVAPFGAWPNTDLPAMPDPQFQQTAHPAVVAVAAPPSGFAGNALLPRMVVPLSSTLLLITVLTGAMALIARSLWKRPAIRAGLTAAYGYVLPRVAALSISVRRGQRWIARAATLFFVLLLALIEWRR